MMLLPRLLCHALLAAATVGDVIPGARSDAPGALHAISNVRLWGGDGHEVIDVTVMWRHGVITYVGQAPPAGTGADVYNGAGKVLTPGFVETRSFLGTLEIDQEPGTRDMDSGHAWATPAYAAADGFNPASEHIPLCREQGVTHAITGPDGHVLGGWAHWVDLGAPATVARSTPAAMWGRVDKHAAAAAGGTRGHLWMQLRELLDDVRFFDTHVTDWEHNRTRALALAPLHLRAVSLALREHIPWVLEANRASDIVRAVEFARQAHIRLVIAGGAEAWQVAPLLAEADVPVITAPSHQEPDSFDSLGARPDGAALLHAAGVQVILSTDLSIMTMPWLRQQAGVAVANGLPQQAALAAITRIPATVFDRGDRIGTLAKGRPATMVLWSADPFELSSTAENVWIDGHETRRTTRQQLLFQRYRKAVP